MAVHMVVLAKLHLLAACHGQNPALVWPLVLKLSLGFRLVRRAYTDSFHTIRLFLFRLRQIASNSGDRDRLERVLRLFARRMIRARRPQSNGDDSLSTLSMLAL